MISTQKLSVSSMRFFRRASLAAAFRAAAIDFVRSLAGLLLLPARPGCVDRWRRLVDVLVWLEPAL
jgi:hypothetical protein